MNKEFVLEQCEVRANVGSFLTNKPHLDFAFIDIVTSEDDQDLMAHRTRRRFHDGR